jgi:solute carrier family 25 (mitochondrial carnitine/acylcarnitine transporter), member 20/29
LFNKSLEKITEWRKHEKSTYTDLLIAGGISGIPCSILMAPAELIKIQIQTGAFSSVKETVKKLNKIPLRSGWLNGMPITIFREIPGFSAYFGSYHLLKECWGESTMATLNAGGMAGIISWTMSYPFDVVKTKLQSQPLYPKEGHNNFNGVFDCARKIYAKEGMSVFFRGFSACLTRTYPVNAVIFYVYDRFLKILQFSSSKKNEEFVTETDKI